MGAAENKSLIEDAFDAWARGQGSFFDLLADDVRWTIPASGSLGGTYTSRRQFIDEAIKPIGERLSVPIRPTVETVVAEGDHVVVLWRGEATAKGGRPYNNRYCWVMRVEGGKVTEATAFFDMKLLEAIW